jgi:putative ABC transport system ATP-binding protein
VLFVRNIEKSFAVGSGSAVVRRRLYHGVSLDVAPGEIIAIMGESGVGKSTLLNLIAGLDVPDAGSIELAGQTLETLDDAARTLLRRALIGFVFQAFHVLPYLSVADNVALPLKLNSATLNAVTASKSERVAEMLAAVGLADRARSMPRELSGGELQRVAIARALVHQPRLLLADEPTGNLDPTTADDVLALFAAEARRNNAAAILVTHSLKAASIADRTLLLRADGLVQIPS